MLAVAPCITDEATFILSANAGNTRSRNVYQKLVQAILFLYKKLARMLVWSCTMYKFFLCKFLKHNLQDRNSLDSNGTTWLAGQLLLILFSLVFSCFSWHILFGFRYDGVEQWWNWCLPVNRFYQKKTFSYDRSEASYLCKKLWWKMPQQQNFSCKLPAQVSGISFLSMSRRH